MSKPAGTPRVSFRQTDDRCSEHAPPTHSPSREAPARPALKHAARVAPAPELYQHPDPLLRRLRLVDGYGRPVDLRRTFRDTKVVAFYFASQLAQRAEKDYDRAVANLCRAHPHEFKAVYVSVDMDERYFAAATRNQPWLAMVWDDGSSVDADADEGGGESFLLAGDEDLDESVVAADAPGTCYVRPFSRVYMADKFDVLVAPTLVIYHVGTRTVLDRGVRAHKLRYGGEEEAAARWLRGERTPSLSAFDVVQLAPWTVVLALVAALYAVVVAVGGEEFHVLRRLGQYIAERTNTAGLQVTSTSDSPR